MNNGLFVVTEYPDVETWHCHVSLLILENLQGNDS